MINYIYGKVIYIGKKYIILESNFIGYKIFLYDTSNFEVNKYQKVYIYKHQKIEKNILIEELFGFCDLISRNLFKDLISINGIGVITATNILKNDINTLISFIANNQYDSLKELNGISEKNAILICSCLSSKLKSLNTNNSDNQEANHDLVLALKELGYSKNDINYALSKCDLTLLLNELVNSSIKLIAQAHQ